MEESPAQTSPVTPIVSQPTPPVTPITPPTPIEPKKTLPKGIILALIIVFLIIAAVCAAAYFLTKPSAKPTAMPEVKIVPTATPTPAPGDLTSWQIYASDFFNFSINYPQDWKQTNQKTTNNFDQSANKTLRYEFASFESPDKISLNIELNENPNFKNNEDYLKSSEPDKDNQRIQIQGVPANFFTRFEEGPMPARGYWTWVSFFNDGKTYNLYLVNPEKLGSKEELMKTIISTLSFTNPTAAIDTSKWQTYSGSLYSFKYPSDWKLDASNTNDLTLKVTQMIGPDGGGSPQPVVTTADFKFAEVPANYTLDQWFQNQYLHTMDQQTYNFVKQNIQDALLDDQKAMFVQLPGAATHLSDATLAVKNNKGFNISINGQTFANNEDVYKQIISTFKFAQ